MKKCLSCSFENSDDSKFCNSCGKEFSTLTPQGTMVRCPKCSNTNPPGTRYCGRCGQPLTQEAANQIARERVPTVTVQSPRRTHPVVVLLAIIAVIIALMLIGPGSCTIPLATITADVAMSQDSKTTKATQAATTEAKTVSKIGEKTNVGDISYTVQKVELSETVGGDYVMATAKGRYLLITITIRNNSDESLTISDSFFKVLFGGKEYSADSTATLYADSESSLWYDELNPDLETTGIIAFDVTDNVAYSTATQLQVQTDFWGTQTGLISLDR